MFNIFHFLFTVVMFTIFIIYYSNRVHGDRMIKIIWIPNIIFFPMYQNK